MSIFKDFDELKFGTKGTVLNIISTIPFFFISIYLFNHKLILKVESNPLFDVDFYFIISICISISLLWFMMNFLLSSICEELYNINIDGKNSDNLEKTNVDNDDSLKTTYIATYIYSVGYLASIFFFNYIWFKLSFKWFILVSFGFIVFRMSFLIIVYLMQKHNSKKLQTHKE